MPSCNDCHPARSFHSKQAKRSHMNAVHLLFCQVCNSKCYGPAGLSQHYRASARHPHCARCGSGFLDRRDLDVHIAEKHPRVFCCGVFVPREDLDSHYFNSINHAKCEPCQTGFEDHNMLEQHNAAQHPIWRCCVCDKEFPSERDLRKHTNYPGIHPQCEFCNKQFKQTSALIDHYASTHLVEALKDTIIDAVTDTCTVVSSPIDGPQGASSPGALSPISISPESSPESSLDFDLSSLDDSLDVLQDLSFLSLSPATTVGPSTPVVQLSAFDDLTPTALTHPTHLFRRGLLAADTPQLRNSFLSPSTPPPRMATPNDTPSGDLSDFRLLTGTPLRRPHLLSEFDLDVDTPMPSPRRKLLVNAVPRLVVECDSPPELKVVKEEEPLHEPVLDVAPTLEDAAGIIEEPMTLVAEVGIPLIEPKPVQAVVATLEPEPEALVEPVPAVDVEPKTEQPMVVIQREVIVESDDVDPEPIMAKSTNSTPARPSSNPRSPFFCRICRVDPCKDITATVCGHLFCHGCIVDEVRQNARCPMCSAAVLLFALLKLDLSDADVAA